METDEGTEWTLENFKHFERKLEGSSFFEAIKLNLHVRTKKHAMRNVPKEQSAVEERL